MQSDDKSSQTTWKIHARRTKAAKLADASQILSKRTRCQHIRLSLLSLLIGTSTEAHPCVAIMAGQLMRWRTTREALPRLTCRKHTHKQRLVEESSAKMSLRCKSQPPLWQLWKGSLRNTHEKAASGVKQIVVDCLSAQQVALAEIS